jgi:hypothetical protein
MAVLNDNLDIKTLPDWEQKRIYSGMRAPRVITLHAGESLYHFASTQNYQGAAIPAGRWAAGPWWIKSHDYQKIVNESKRSGMTMGYTARVSAAIQQSYSRVDVVVEAMVVKDIMAFAGAGQKQHREMAPNGMYITMGGWNDVTQLYIPNIADRNGLTALFGQALVVKKQEVINSQQLYPMKSK